VLSVFGDESHDELKQRVFAVGGLIGREKEWDALKASLEKRTKGKVFHAADCESDEGEFKGLDHKENLKLYADFTKIIARTKMMGFGVAIDLREYHAIFPELPEDQPYYLCFHDVVKYFANIGYLHVPQETVDFTFDRNLEREYNATYLYDYMVKQPGWRFSPYIADKVSFADRRNSAVWGADIVARETMKHLDNQIGPVRRWPRGSIAALARTRRFQFHFYVRKSLLALARMAQDPDTARRSEDQLGFRDWLSQLKLPDTIANRIRYIQYVKREPKP
jgi:hypothetical protein